MSSEWLSTGTVVHQPPTYRVGDLAKHTDLPSVGPREAAEMAQLLSVAETMVPKPPPPFNELTSIHRQEFVQHDTSGIVYVPSSAHCQLKLQRIALHPEMHEQSLLHDAVVTCRPGRVQMLTQDRGPVCRDKTFLSEEKLLAQSTAGRFVGGKKPLEKTLESLPQEVPITIYSEALTKGSYNSTQYGSKHFGSTTFGKHSNFTKPVGDYTKDPSDE